MTTCNVGHISNKFRQNVDVASALTDSVCACITEYNKYVFNIAVLCANVNN